MGAVLESRIGGSVPKEDKIEIAREGNSFDGNYVVRKGHYSLDTENNKDLFIKPHLLGSKALYKLHSEGNAKGIIIYRDPRDAVVSASYYFGHTVSEMLKDYGEGIGHMRGVGSFMSFWNTWRNFPFPFIRYETLLLDPLNSLSLILFYNNIAYPGIGHLKRCVEENRFDRQKEVAVDHDYKRLLRNGKVGDWKKEFEPADKLAASRYFNEFLIHYSYESVENWWWTKEIKK